MSKLIDITENRYSKLVVLERAENAKGGISVWKCRCDCGNITYVRGHNLKDGRVKSCGCSKHIPHTLTHGMSKTRLYREWASIKSRCCYRSAVRFKDYAPRGITMCDEWKDSFETFRDWALANGYKDDLTIERIDNEKGYCPENCKWIPNCLQANNRRMNYRFTINGQTKNLSELCKEYNVDYHLAHNRIHKLGWDIEKAITTPCDINKRNKRGKKKCQNT